MGKASDTGGVVPMAIAGRLVRERERLLGMTDAERAFRKQWLKDQELSPNEPRVVPEIYKATHNPIRRFYRFPLNQYQNFLTPIVGAENAAVLRYLTAKAGMTIVLIYAGYYIFKYHSNEWDRKTGWKLFSTRPAVLPGDPGYPKLSDRTKPSDYASRGFNNVTLNL
ncbi:NADH dehydrogenase [ubiquinone] 1 beta subcomplex subunit 6 [Euwallacea fornicatus]|uniref:NADH dehydrogenase [ubiquinone] 1 beta subcomplex subunit 6 n=1 Tax=Euwallacea fornicatus TaxID=995702 RepID=UPI00339048AA